MVEPTCAIMADKCTRKVLSFYKKLNSLTRMLVNIKMTLRYNKLNLSLSIT